MYKLINMPLKVVHKSVVDYFQCEFDAPFAHDRKQSTVSLRRWFFYISREMNPEYIVSLDHIGRYWEKFGRIFQHDVVLKHHRRIKGFIEIYPEYRKIEQDLTKLCYQNLKIHQQILAETEKKSCTPIVFNVQSLNNIK